METVNNLPAFSFLLLRGEKCPPTSCRACSFLRPAHSRVKCNIFSPPIYILDTDIPVCTAENWKTAARRELGVPEDKTRRNGKAIVLLKEIVAVIKKDL